MEKREARRARDWRHSVRARREHLRIFRGGGERSVWFFRKRNAIGCDCRRREVGNPKLSRGDWGYRPAVRERIEGRRLCRGWERWAGAAEDCEL